MKGMEIEIEFEGRRKRLVYQEQDLDSIDPSRGKRYIMGILKVRVSDELDALRLAYRTMPQSPRLEKMDGYYLVRYLFAPESVSEVRSFAGRLKAMEDEVLAPVD